MDGLFTIIQKFISFLLYDIIVPLIPIAIYFLLICCMLTIIMSLSGIFGTFIFMGVLYFYIKGVLLYNPSVPGRNN